MARHEHIPIFQKTYALVLVVYKATENFKKSYKYTLGEKLKITVHELLDLIMKANSLPDNEKIRYFPFWIMI